MASNVNEGESVGCCGWFSCLKELEASVDIVACVARTVSDELGVVTVDVLVVVGME